MGKPLDEAAATAAARAATVGAAPLSDNGYKVGLVQTLVRRTLLSLADEARHDRHLSAARPRAEVRSASGCARRCTT